MTTYQLSVWIMGRAYIGSKSEDKADLAKQARLMLKDMQAIGYVTLYSLTVPFEPGILFAWGRIMWQDTQTDLSETELKELFDA